MSHPIMRNRQMVTGRRSRDPLFTNVYELFSDRLTEPVGDEVHEELSVREIVRIALAAMEYQVLPSHHKSLRGVRIPGIVGWQYGHATGAAARRCMLELARRTNLDPKTIVTEWEDQWTAKRKPRLTHRRPAKQPFTPKRGKVLSFEDGEMAYTSFTRQELQRIRKRDRRRAEEAA